MASAPPSCRRVESSSFRLRPCGALIRCGAVLVLACGSEGGLRSVGAADRHFPDAKLGYNDVGLESAVTIWGVSADHTWLDSWPVNGRANYASLFDREIEPKAAWQSVIDVASSAA